MKKYSFKFYMPSFGAFLTTPLMISSSFRGINIENIWELIPSVQRQATTTMKLFYFLSWILQLLTLECVFSYHVQCTFAEQCSLLRAAVLWWSVWFCIWSCVSQFGFVCDPVCHSLVLCVIPCVTIPVTLCSTSCCVPGQWGMDRAAALISTSGSGR